MPSEQLTPLQLLAAPRGRRLLLELALSLEHGNESSEVSPLWHAVFYASYPLAKRAGKSISYFVIGTPDADHNPARPPDTTPSEVAEILAATQFNEPTRDVVRASLAASVDAAMYWEGPDGDDLLAATVEVRAALEGWAQRACSSSAMGWLSAGFAPATQVSLSWQRGRPGTGALAPSPPADEVLLAWQAEAIRREAEAAERLSEDTIPYSGSWWATPPHHLAVTCAPLFDGTPSGLWFIEDDSGWSRALARRVEVAPGARVFEVDAAEDWARLCREFPLTVTASRRHDWYRATGWAGELVVPDWAAVSMSYDAIHLSYAGYLSGAGLAIPVGEGTASVIAGWNPGATYWLSDKAQPVGEAVEWVSTDDGPRRQA